MADLSITAANVKLKTSTGVFVLQVGEAVAQGRTLYQRASDGKYMLGDADVLATSLVRYIALTPASTDGYVVAVRDGEIDLGATLTAGATYVASTTPGGIAPIADLASGDFKTILGTARDASTLVLDIAATGIALA
jgi:hypothetical protein